MKKYLNGKLVELTSDEIAEHNELIATAAAYEKTFKDATKLKETNKTSAKAKLK